MRNKLQVVQHIILFTLVLATGLSNAGASDDMLASVMQRPGDDPAEHDGLRDRRPQPTPTSIMPPGD